MKKLKITLIIALLTFAVAGCGGKSVETPNPEPNPEVVKKEDKIEEKVIGIQKLKPEISEYTEVASYVGDVDADGNNERVVLSTAAERDKNGEFLWNDGQNWVLYIETPEGAYVLLDEYIQMGKVYFEVSDFYMTEGIEPKVLVTKTTGAGFSLKSYSFSEKAEGYIEEVLYDTQKMTEAGLNRKFSSFPEI